MTHYTIEQANELLPHLAPTLMELRDKYDKAMEVQAVVADSAVTNGGSTKRRRWEQLLTRVQALMERLEGWDIQLRDIDTGLIDFPAIVDGREAYLCWRLGEERVAFWHGTDEGFANRKPL